jgi:hypothetical protein
MHFEASRIASVTPLPLPAAPASPWATPETGRFARLYDLAAERERRTPPPEVLDAVAEAARVYEELDAAGLHVRFDLISGASAQLHDGEGAVRSLTLLEVIDPTSLLPPDAA